MKKSLLMGAVMLLLTFALQPAFAQMNYWGLMPNKIDFTGATPTKSTMTGAPAPISYQGYNAMWDNNGNLLFYIVGGSIYKPNNTIVGGVSQPAASFTSGIPPKTVYHYPRQDAYYIVPAPGSATRYYVFHSGFCSFSGVALIYTIVDCPTPGTVTVTNPTNARLFDVSIGNSSTIAITKPRIDNSRYLFFFTGGASGATTMDLIKYFIITPTGITTPTSNTIFTAPLNTSTMETLDAEVYEDQDGYLLSWCSGSYEKFSCLKLTSALAVSATYNYTLPAGHKAANVEFSADGKFIYATVGGNASRGVYKAPITGTATLIPGSTNYFLSQIELAKDGLFYLANISGQLSTLNPVTNTFAVSPLGVTLTATYYCSAAGYIYTLPEQLDQENYSCITTQPCIPYNTNINYVVPMVSSCATTWSISTCSSVTFNTSHSIPPTAYMLQIESINGSCGVATGSDKIQYNSGWVAGGAPPYYDISNLTDAYGNTISTVPGGKVRITYSVKNSCGAIRTVYTYLNTGSPKVGLTDFKLNNTTITSNCAAPYEVMSCNTPALLFSPVLKNAPSSYQLTIQALDAACSPISGTGLINYNSGWLSGGLANNTDLYTFTDANGISLNGYNGVVLISYSVRDVCGYVVTTASHRVRISGAPTPGGTKLTLNSYSNPGIPVAASTTTPGIVLGIYSGGFNLTSTAAFNSYNVTVDEVDCSTGFVTGNICNLTNMLATPVTSITSINLNNLYVPAIPSKSWGGGMGFFANKGYGSCFNVTVTPTNTCGTTSVSSYVQTNCYCRMGVAEGIVVEEGQSAFYPTIFEEEFYADYILEGSENVVSVKIYDLSGKLISTPVENLSQSSGVNHLTVKVPAMAPGSYIVVVEANGAKYSQLMNKK